MLRCIFSRLALAIFAAGFVFSAVALSQPQDSQSQSVAEAARRAREQKAQDQKNKPPKTTKVITDDDLDAKKAQSDDQSRPPAISTVGQETADRPAEASSSNASGTKADSSEVARIKAQLAQAENDLQMSQRELALARRLSC